MKQNKMNLPNRLTLARIAAVPVFLILLLWQFPFHYFAALVIFVAASLTDLFDGRIARSRGLITDFGKFLDPIADKMLTTAALLGFISLGIVFGTVWITVIVLIKRVFGKLDTYDRRRLGQGGRRRQVGENQNGYADGGNNNGPYL